MFPGLGGMDPRKMKMMMQQLGIKTEEIKAKKVIFELENSRLVIENPNVTAMNMQGQKTYTVMGNAVEEETEAEIPESDIEMVAEQTGIGKEEAKAALEETGGDIAEAIEKLKK